MQSFDEVYDAFGPMIYARCRKMLRNEQDAQEMFQEVLIKLNLNLKEVAAADNKAGWIYRVTTNVCLNRLRTIKRKSLPDWIDPDLVSSGASTPENHLWSKHTLAKVMERLKRRDQEILYMFFVDRMTQDEIAEVAQLSRITVARVVSHIRELAEAQP